MRFKEFSNWANERWQDGQWGAGLATDCMTVGTAVRKEPFWRREKKWKQLCNDCYPDLITRIKATDTIRREKGFLVD